MIVARSFDAARFNQIINHPSIRPDIAEGHGIVDAAFQIENRENVFLLGEHGGVLFLRIMIGVYEAHTFVLPEGRGDWSAAMANDGVSWMFVNTGAYDLVTRVPRGHLAAKALALRVGGRFEFATLPGAMFRSQMTPMDTYSLRVQDWWPRAQGFADRGKWVHERMAAEAERLGVSEPAHGDQDMAHFQIVGVCFEMARAGQLIKGVTLYNRWAILARHPTISVVSKDPPSIKMDIGTMTLRNGDIEIAA